MALCRIRGEDESERACNHRLGAAGDLDAPFNWRFHDTLWMELDTRERVCRCPDESTASLAEQFLNEKLIVDVLKVGVSVGVKAPSTWGVDTDEVLVKNCDIQRAVQSLMDDSEEAEERRNRAKEFSKKARYMWISN